MDTHGAPPSVSQAEAARICGVSTATIRRRRSELIEHGAKPDVDGGWTIPIPALVAVGLLDRTTPPDTATTRRMSPDTTRQSATPMTPPDEVAELRNRLRETEHRAALAEAISEERLRALEDARTALRLLEARPHGHAERVQAGSEQGREQYSDLLHRFGEEEQRPTDTPTDTLTDRPTHTLTDTHGQGRWERFKRKWSRR